MHGLPCGETACTIRLQPMQFVERCAELVELTDVDAGYAYPQLDMYTLQSAPHFAERELTVHSPI